MSGKIRKKQKTSARKSEYSPLQKAVIVFSVLIILASITATAVYLAGRGGEEKVPEPEPTRNEEQQEQTPEPEPVWDGVSLQETEDAGQEYVDETLFLGDSNFLRMVAQNVLTHRNVIGLPGKGIQCVRSDRDVYLSGYGEGMTAVSAVKILRPRRILINFGTNNLLGQLDSFISTYKGAISAIQRTYEYSDIIVMSIPPLGKDVYTEYGTLTMKTVDEYNEALKEMCRELEIPFLNVTDECLKDPETGFARSEIMYEDGIHIEGNGLTELIEYYRTHAYITEDKRPSKQSSTYVVWPPAQPDEFDCDSVLTDVCVRLVAEGFDMASGSSDEEGSVRYLSYSVPGSAEAGEEGAYAQNIATYISANCSKSAKLRLTWSGDGTGSYVFSVKEIIPCTEHTYGEWTVEKAATCSSGGRRKRACTNCGHTETEETEIDPSAHAYSWETVREATCSAPGEEKGTCTLCGDVTTRETYKDHVPEVRQQEQAATCTDEGYTREVICSVCGEVIEERTTVPALGHDYSSSVTKEPTETEDGVMTYTCSRCGDTRTEAIPATGNSDPGEETPPSGDDTPGGESPAGDSEPEPEPEPEPTPEPEGDG